MEEKNLKDESTSERELTSAYTQHRDELCGVLRRRFPQLDPEDLLQDVWVKILPKAQEGWRPDESWRAYLREAVLHRGIDVLRRHEIKSLDALAGNQPADSGPSPSDAMQEGERRHRQGLTLSDIMKDYVRRCESRPVMLKQKEIYERLLRGQKQEDIVKAMGVKRGALDQAIRRARDWFQARICQADVHRSVFLTLHGQKPQE